MWKTLWTAIIVMVALTPCKAFSAGLTSNDNFIVLSPPLPNQSAAQRYAEKIAREADELRNNIATEWFGKPLPDRTGRTIVNIQFSDEPDSALTWAKNSTDRKFHSIYLKTPQSETVALGLAHEVAHTVLATKFPHPNRLPPWIEESIACRYDDKARIEQRKRVLIKLTRNRNWPRLESVLNAENISSADADAYAVACSVADYLLTLGDKAKFIEFGARIKKVGLRTSLQQAYGLRRVLDLESRWRRWVVANGSRRSPQVARNLAVPIRSANVFAKVSLKP